MFSKSSDARFWDRIARKYAADPIADMAGYERTLARTRELMKGDEAVFEFGCGTGTTALRLAPSVRCILATDISREMIAIAREKAHAQGCANVDFDVVKPHAAAWPDGAFDVALGFNVLHLMAARNETLRAVHGMLKPGGLFISKTPCLMEMNPLIRLALPVMQFVGKAPFVSVLSASDLEREIVAAGFEIVERARHGTKGKDARPFLVVRKV